MTPDDPTPPDGTTRPDAPTDPAASPGGRNRLPAEAMPDADAVVTRLRSALDELTAGAEPSASPVTPLTRRRERRWLLPAVAAAAVIAVVGVAVAIAGGDGGTAPAAPTPTGAPVPTRPPPGAATIPWYELQAEGADAEAPLNQTGSDPLRTQVWATRSFSRMLVAVSSDLPAGSSAQDVRDQLPADVGIVEGAVGHAWVVADNAGDPASRGYLVWTPDDRTVLNVLAYGIDTLDLVQVAITGTVTRDEFGARLDSPLSSLEPLVDDIAPLDLVTQAYTLADGAEVAVMVSADGPAFALRSYGSWAQRLIATHTSFGGGFRLELDGLTMVWWQVDDGPFWAGFSAPADRFDDLFDHLVRADDLPLAAAIASVDVALGTTPPPESATTSPALDDPGSASTSPPPCIAHATDAPTATTAPPSLGATTTTVDPCAPDGVPTATATTVTAPSLPPGSESTTAASTVPSLQEPTMTAAVPTSLASGWRPPIAVGESVMLSAVQALGARGIEVHASEAVQAAGIGEQLELLRDTDRLGDVVIVQVGTNGTITEADLDRIMAALTEVERVVVLTVHADRSWIAPNNELIRALPSRYPNVTIADWDQLAVAEPGVLASDGIHVDDRDAYADAIAAAAGLG